MSLIVNWVENVNPIGFTKIRGWNASSYQPIVSGTMSPFPGSRQMWVSAHLEVASEWRHLGVGREYHQYITETFLPHVGGRAIVATVHVENNVQQERLRKLGWKQLSKTLWLWKPNS